MPELPEVEITRRHLEPAMAGRQLDHVNVSHERTARYNASAREVVARLQGRQIESVGRHGKFLVMGLDDGQALVAHLGMSGRFSLASAPDEMVRHTHAVFGMGERQARFIDPRTFGFVAVYDEDELDLSPLARLGRDAWDDPPDSEELKSRLKGRTAPIKALLLDQSHIAGLGNIYADEVLHRSGVHPMTEGGRLTPDQLATMLAAVRDVLAAAIDSGGTTLDDLAYLLPDGRAGDNLERLAVYGREGEECLRCEGVIDRIVVRSRSTHFCPDCQQ